jgi:hypothetical protein
MAGEFSVQYADNPWGDISMLEKPVSSYAPNLLANYRRAAKWGRFVGAQINLAAMQTRTMTVTRQLDGEPNFDAKNPKTLFFPVSTFAGLQRKSVTLEYHYDHIAWHEDDNLFNYLDVSLEGFARGQLGWNMALYFDYLYRNEALTSDYARYGSDTVYDGFDHLTADTELFEITWIPQILLGMEYEDIVDSETGMPSVAAMTTPGVIHDIATQAGGEWRALNSFTPEGRAALMEYGISGTYMGVGFIPTRANVLWCTGAIEAQFAIVEHLNTQDGVSASDNSQGWNSAQDGIKNYIQLHSTGETGAITDIDVGDIVVIHRRRGNTFGVTNGVLPTDGTADHRVVVEVDEANYRIVIDKPWLKDGYTTPLADGSYGYVTKADHIHMTSFIGDAGALQVAVAQPPLMKAAPPIDHLMKQHRVSWDAWIKPVLMNHGGIRNWFTRGSYVTPGTMVPNI